MHLASSDTDEQRNVQYLAICKRTLPLDAPVRLRDCASVTLQIFTKCLRGSYLLKFL